MKNRIRIRRLGMAAIAVAALFGMAGGRVRPDDASRYRVRSAKETRLSAVFHLAGVGSRGSIPERIPYV